jgi:hypothetical protein
MHNTLAVVLMGELIETSDGSEILRIARRLEFRVRQTKIVALKMRVLLQLAGQQTAAQRAIGQGRKTRFPAIGQKLLLDLALEQIIGRLHNVQLGDAAKSFNLRNREIAHANSADLPLVEECLHRFGGLFDRHQRVGPMDLIDIDIIGAQPAQRVGRLAQDPVTAGVPEDFPVFPLEPGFGGNDDVWAQAAFGNCLADDLFGAAKSIGRRRVDKVDPAFDGGVDRLDRLFLLRPAPHPAADRPGSKADA